MPSHRQGKIPKHRVRRPQQIFGRRSQLNAANLAKRIAPESGPPAAESRSWPATPEPSTQPLARDGQPRDGQPRPGQDGGSQSGGSRDGRRRSAAAARRRRGLLVTPWFAAGAGFVVAAALSLNSPRTFLTYRHDGGSDSKCVSCQSPESVPTSRPGVQIKSVNPAPPGGTSPAPILAVPIQLGTEQNGVFSVTFMLPPGQVRNGWKLAFVLPGRSITEVVGAQWRPDAAQDGGVFSEPAEGGYVSPADPDAVSILVSASGTPVTPVQCVLNGQPCRFGS